MKIQFTPQDFLRLFKLAASAAAARDIKPILQNVKIVADKEVGTVLMATDTEIGIRVRLDADVLENGIALLPIKTLRTILDSTKEKILTMENVMTTPDIDDNSESESSKNTESESTDDAEGEDEYVRYTPQRQGSCSVVLYGQHERHELCTSSPDEFPNVEEFTAEAYHELETEDMKTLILRTVFAIDKDNPRYALGGVCFEGKVGHDVLTAIATDGRRLSVQTTDHCMIVGNPTIGHIRKESLEDGTERIDYPIVGTPALNLLTKVLNDKTFKKQKKHIYSSTVKMVFDDHRVLFHCESAQGNEQITIFARLLEGRFPKWQRIAIPMSGEKDAPSPNQAWSENGTDLTALRKQENEKQLAQMRQDVEAKVAAQLADADDESDTESDVPIDENGEVTTDYFHNEIPNTFVNPVNGTTVHFDSYNFDYPVYCPDEHLFRAEFDHDDTTWTMEWDCVSGKRIVPDWRYPQRITAPKIPLDENGYMTWDYLESFNEGVPLSEMELPRFLPEESLFRTTGKSTDGESVVVEWACIPGKRRLVATKMEGIGTIDDWASPSRIIPLDEFTEEIIERGGLLAEAEDEVCQWCEESRCACDYEDAPSEWATDDADESETESAIEPTAEANYESDTEIEDDVELRFEKLTDAIDSIVEAYNDEAVAFFAPKLRYQRFLSEIVRTHFDTPWAMREEFRYERRKAGIHSPGFNAFVEQWSAKVTEMNIEDSVEAMRTVYESLLSGLRSVRSSIDFSGDPVEGFLRVAFPSNVISSTAVGDVPGDVSISAKPVDGIGTASQHTGTRQVILRRK